MKRLLASVLLAIPLEASTLSIQNYCTAPGKETISGEAGCSSGIEYGAYPSGSSASASVSRSFGDLTSYSSINIKQSTFAGGAYSADGKWQTAMSDSKVYIEDNLRSSGPQRSGLVEVLLSGGGYNLSTGDGYIDGKLALTDDNGHLIMGMNGGSEFKTGYSRTHGEFFNVELGTTLHFTYSGEANALALLPYESTSYENVDFTYHVRFFEADATTPVMVTENPEPGTIGLFALPIALLLFGKWLRSKLW